MSIITVVEDTIKNEDGRLIYRAKIFWNGQFKSNADFDSYEQLKEFIETIASKSPDSP